MRHIKTYEENINKPEVGDYIIFKDKGALDKFQEKREDFNYFLSKNFGKIIYKDKDSKMYKVMYDAEPNINALDYGFYRKNDPSLINIPNIKIFQANYTNVTSANDDEILFFAPTKEELELKVNLNTYNI